MADLDVASFCAIAFIDFESGLSIERMDVRRSGFTTFADRVDDSIAWHGDAMSCAVAREAGSIAVRISCDDVQGAAVRADFAMQPAVGHESLNVVVPRSRKRFQLNSKHNTLPCTGRLDVGPRRYAMSPRRVTVCRTGDAGSGPIARSGTERSAPACKTVCRWA